MKHLTVALLTGSPLIDAGFRQILTGLTDRGVDIVNVKGNGDVAHEIAGLSPSMLIVSPMMLMSVTPGELREMTGGKMPVVAVTGGRLPEVADREFDIVLSLFDTPEQILSRLRETVSDDDDEDPKELSPRERDVIVGIVKGLSNKEIAAEINVSVNTVMTHRRNISRKLQIHSSAALTVYAIVKKLVRMDEIRNMLPPGV